MPINNALMNQLLTSIRRRREEEVAKNDPTKAWQDSVSTSSERIVSGTADDRDYARALMAGRIKASEPLRPSQAIEDSIAARTLRGDIKGAGELYRGIHPLTPKEPARPSQVLADSTAARALRGDVKGAQELYRSTHPLAPEKPEVEYQKHLSSITDIQMKIGNLNAIEPSSLMIEGASPDLQLYLESMSKKSKLTPEDKQKIRSALEKELRWHQAEISKYEIAGVPEGAAKVGTHKTTGKPVYKLPDGQLWTE